MLPPRAHVEPLARSSSNPRAQPSPAEARPSLIVAVEDGDIDRFPSSPYVRLAARSTTEAVRLIERWRPRVIAIDWELPALDAGAVCTAARQQGVGVLAVMSEPGRAPLALKAGCHSVLLKPFSLNLAAARLGRLCREMPATGSLAGSRGIRIPSGTNRAWPEVACPKCGTGGAVGFEFASHRRSWYACLGCEHVWIGPRRE